ncbi:MAG: riboflavin biosynthesis protein RibF [Bacteroidetes bacterium GWF2_40_14]|nr:MAG: riboflavin biosynthesis protein RibF [Bacteroidetes bacterium GWF2_40_14]
MVVGSTGFFDGVHRGHLAVINKVCLLAREQGCRSLVFTFWPHPRAVLQQDAAKFRLLTTLEEKRNLLINYGIDEVVVLPFDKDFANQTTREFFKNYLSDRYQVSTLVVGYDHRVGCDVNQTQQEMFEIARELGINPVRVEEVSADDKYPKISSTKIRELLLQGNIEQANSLLGYRYGLEGVVVEGLRIGRTIGFPTANIRLYEPLKIVPGDGVYSVWVDYSGKTYRGITNIGTRPTIGQGNERSIETHILDFDEDIYGLPLKIEFAGKMRNEKRFESLEDLKTQLFIDREDSKAFLDNDGIKLR